MHAPGTFPATFVGGSLGSWRVERFTAVRGEPLAAVSHVDVRPGLGQASGDWTLRGVAGHVRYVERHEKTPLDRRSPPLLRGEATRAALIPIRKSAAWWALPQDERRAVLETRSNHIAEGLRYLPAIARRLYHARDLGEPFDFVTWFEFAPADSAVFDELVAFLRSREEWTFVEREIDIRLTR